MEQKEKLELEKAFTVCISIFRHF